MTTTTNHDYDAIVVGARCAGAPTAMLLARRGHRVLLVDRATFPSDTLSTLVIHGHGVAALDRWGVLDDVLATGCPTFDRYVFDFGPLVISGSPLPHPSFAIAPRRKVLDKLLVDAAAGAGVDVREAVTLEDLLVADGTVAGIRASGATGDRLDVTARVVVGADGWNSFVARRVDAARRFEKPVLENAFYTYWSGLPFDAFTTYIRGDRGIAAIPTNDGLTLVLVGCPFAQAADFRRDVEASYMAAIDREPELAKRMRSATREERIVGGGVPNFLRTPSGPGWILVGDASYTRDPITAQGITHAFHSAEWCADALDDVLSGRRTFDDATEDYRATRDRDVLPLYELTTQLATLEPPPPELQAYLGSIAGHQAAMDAFVSVMAGTLSPAEGMPAPG
jgi:2-polyprenyl-6-methoxyphenol hydroxylase-like FAD-dependent oxidoreductase